MRFLTLVLFVSFLSLAACSKDEKEVPTLQGESGLSGGSGGGGGAPGGDGGPFAGAGNNASNPEVYPYMGNPMLTSPADYSLRPQNPQGSWDPRASQSPFNPSTGYSSRRRQ